MVIELLHQMQGNNLGFQIAVIGGVVGAYVLFELVVANALQRRVRTQR